jgi:hypothetical protein
VREALGESLAQDFMAGAPPPPALVAQLAIEGGEDPEMIAAQLRWLQQQHMQAKREEEERNELSGCALVWCLCDLLRCLCFLSQF